MNNLENLYTDKEKYSIVQPDMVVLPDGSKESNPFYSQSLNKEYWVYKLLISSNIDEKICDIFIPINHNIASSHIKVSTRVLGFEEFKESPFEILLAKDIGNETLLRYIHLPLDNWIKSGVSLYLRLELKGTYSRSQHPLILKVGNNLYRTEDMFSIPGPPRGNRVSIIKNSLLHIEDNRARIDHTVVLRNNSNEILKDIQINDNNYLMSSAMEIDELQCDLSIQPKYEDGLICIEHKIDMLEPGEEIIIPYSIPVSSIESCGIYYFNSTSSAFSEFDFACIQNEEKIEVAELKLGCNWESPATSTAVLNISMESIHPSPQTEVIIDMVIRIPKGLTVFYKGENGLHGEVSGGEIPLSIRLNVPPFSKVFYKLLIRLLSLDDVDLLPLKIECIVIALKPVPERNQIVLFHSKGQNKKTLYVNNQLRINT